jgi:RNA polymerase sigma factor (sigma-70 family)
MYQEKGPALLAVARRCLEAEGIEHRVTPEDIVHDAITIALANHRKKPIDNVDGYIYRVIVNQVRDESRRKGTAQPIDMFTYEAERIGVLHISEITETKEDLIEDRIDLENALLSLPEQQKKMVMLAKGFDYTHAEIAEITGRHRGTVAQHVSRGTRALTLLLTTTASSLACAMLACFASFGGGKLVPGQSAGARAIEQFDGYSPWVTTLVVLALSVLFIILWRLRSTIQTLHANERARLAEIYQRMEREQRHGGVLSGLERSPTIAEFSAALGVPEEDIISAQSVARDLVTPVGSRTILPPAPVWGARRK